MALSALVGVALLSSLSPIAVSANSNISDACGTPVDAQQVDPKHINLVIDDSGSMFYDGASRQQLDRWSFAKYSLEAFAALMDPEDSLDVYLMSDFVGADGIGGPRVRLTGNQPAEARVAQIHSLELQGSGTPYASVQQAQSDIQSNPTQGKWLVILTDGEFRESRVAVPTDRVQTELIEFVKASRESGNQVDVAFMAIGDEAPELNPGPNQEIFFRKAATSSDLLNQMGSFANRIFERNVVTLSNPWVWTPDLDLEEVIIFAQGNGVTVESASYGGVIQSPDSKVDVTWTNNKNITWVNGDVIEAIPNTDLVGQIATFQNVPQGEISFDIKNASRVDLFYKPKVRFGVRLLDSDGNLVTDDKLIAGEYTVEYGFMNDACEIVSSELLGDDNYQATVIQNGEIVATDVKPGDTLAFRPGEAIFEVSATYLNGIPANDAIERRFLQPALPSEVVVDVLKFKVSQLAPDSGVQTAFPLLYRVLAEDGQWRAPTAAEWEGLSENDFEITGDANWDMQILKGDEPGELLLDIKAPDGDVYKASHGDGIVNIKSSRIFDEQFSETEVSVPYEVENDISGWDRFVNFMKTTGWKILLALLLLTLLAGYLTKKRFSKKVKAKPSITGTPKTVGVTAVEDRGKFQAGGFRKFLPFVANTATLSYVPPGTVGFRPMKLKAGPQKSMIVTNWKEIAEKENVEINGTPLNKETKRAPKLRAGSTISASTPQMTYELTPSN